MYNTPTSWDPTWVASLTLCASPPDKDLDDLERVKYSSPTSIKNCILIKISLIISSEILISLSDSLLFKFSNQLLRSERSISLSWKISLLLILNDLDSIFNLLPSQDLHFFMSTNWSAHRLKFFDSLLFNWSLINDSIPI